MAKQVKKDNIAIEKSSVTLNLKGKKVTLSMEEIRQLSYKLNSFIGNYYYTGFSVSPSVLGSSYVSTNEAMLVDNGTSSLTGNAVDSSITIGDENE